MFRKKSQNEGPALQMLQQMVAGKCIYDEYKAVLISSASARG